MALQLTHGACVGGVFRYRMFRGKCVCVCVCVCVGFSNKIGICMVEVCVNL